MAANSRLEKLTREGENIGNWAGKKIHKVEFLYEAAEKCRAEGYKQYQNQRLDIAYVMFLRFAKFYELIKTQPSLDPKSAAHNKCKRDLLQSLTLMEELKVRLRLRVRVKTLTLTLTLTRRSCWSSTASRRRWLRRRWR